LTGEVDHRDSFVRRDDWLRRGFLMMLDGSSEANIRRSESRMTEDLKMPPGPSGL